MSSDGGMLPLESPYSPHGSSVDSGLISWFETRSPTCSGLHVTPVVAKLCRHYGPDSAPGAFASRCGPYLDLCTVGCDSPFQALLCLHKATFSLAGPGWGYGSRLACRRRAAGIAWVCNHPCLCRFRLSSTAPGQTVPPGMTVTWTVFPLIRQPWCPRACTKPPTVSPQISTPLLKPTS